MMRRQWVLDKENYNESVKLTWLTCLFNEGFSQPMCKASLIYCKNLDIKLVFAPYKIKDLFSAKDAISKLSRSRVVYKFSCAGCSACYVGETNRHLATRVREHITSDKNSHIFQHINGSEACRSLCLEDCFSILCTASTSFQLKIKEALHIGWEKPSLNKQVNHVNLTFSL